MTTKCLNNFLGYWTIDIKMTSVSSKTTPHKPRWFEILKQQHFLQFLDRKIFQNNLVNKKVFLALFRAGLLKKYI